MRWGVFVILLGGSGALHVGCGRLGFQLGDDQDAGETPAEDAGDTDSRVMDSGMEGADSGARASCDDGIQNQGEPFVDSGGPCPVRVNRCGEVDPWTAALWRFENDTASMIQDEQGSPPGSVIGASVEFPLEPGAPCGRSLQASPSGAVGIAPVPVLRIDDGSVDFFFRVGAPPPTRSGIILSRDGSGAIGGHLLVAYNRQGRLVVRLQEEGAVGEENLRCSEVLTPGWVRVGINFGSPDLELFIDGIEQRWVGTTFLFANPVDCIADRFVQGLTDAPTAISIGAGNYSSTPGTNDLLRDHVEPDWRIDEVRFSNVRRDFAQ